MRSGFFFVADFLVESCAGDDCDTTLLELVDVLTLNSFYKYKRKKEIFFNMQGELNQLTYILIKKPID